MRKILLSVVLSVVSGCSAMESLKSANTQNLLINTPHVEGAECAVSDKTGRKWNLWETPGTVAIQEGHPPLVIICTKKGFKKSVLTINEHKEELLTIDGKRIDVSIYGHFPTKFPRLIPAAIKETAGFVQDPTGSLSTTYPNEVIVWMEPNKWESEEQMREWAFDREVQDRSDFISEQDAKLTDEERQAKRRAEKKQRDEDFKKFKKRLQDAGKKGVKNTMKMLNPKPAIDNAVESGRVMLNVDEELEKTRNGISAGIDKTNTSIRKGVTEGIVPGSEKAINGVNPGSAVDFLNKRNDVKARTRSMREKNAVVPSTNDGVSSGAVPYRLPKDMDEAMPQDLYDNADKESKSNGYKSQYDEKGNRIIP